MRSALSQQQAGALEAAETLYRRALDIAPGTPDALHMLGAICYQTGRRWEAFGLIHRALDLTEWQFAGMRHNMGLIVAHLMREPDADAYEQDTADDRARAQLWAASEKLVALARNVEQHALADERVPLHVPASTARRFRSSSGIRPTSFHVFLHPKHCRAYRVGQLRDHCGRRCFE
jgi:Tfp pilus assembly protein PilF